MGRRIIITVIVAVALVLFAQAAIAGMMDTGTIGTK